MILYENFLGGQISDNPLSSVATTVNSAGFANLPVVAGVDRMWLVLDPEGVNGNPEIVLVSAHTSSATSVTVLRGQQTGLGGFAAREHATATEWVCAATAQDMVSLLSTLLTAKGDLPTISAANTPARVPVGTDGLPLTADSAQTTGLAYAQLATAGIADDAVTPAKLSFGRTAVSLDRQTDLTFANETTVLITWENELFEGPAGWIATPGNTLTVPVGAPTGNYAITTNADFSTTFTMPNGGGTRIRTGGSLPRDFWIPAMGNGAIFSACVVTRLAPGDTLDVALFQASGSARNMNSAVLAVELITPF